MEDSKKRAELLIDRYLSGDITAAEAEELEAAYLNAAMKKQYPSIAENDLADLNQRGRESLAELIAAIRATRSKPVRLWPRIAVAAAAVAAITLGTWLYYASNMSGSSSRGTEGSLAYANDIAPGKNTATLTLANGKTINLSDAKTGVIINKSGLKYNDQSEIASSLRFPRNDGEAVMLTASTPRGGTYQVVLPDGTKVWLNADSKIEFPSQFIGRERKIMLSGEAYLEVAKVMIKDKGTRNKGKRMPFIVESAGSNGKPGQIVEVLGTHFNINAYADEGVTKTTLLEGSVSVSSLFTSSASGGLTSSSLRGRTEESRTEPFSELLRDTRKTNLPGRGPSTARSQNNNEIASSRRASRNDGQVGEAIILKPNQQSVLTNNNRITVNKIDAEASIAWKNGEFVFENESVQSIMRKIARWYDVDVIYEGDVANKEIWGSVSKYEQVSKVLKMLAGAQTVDFEIRNKTIVVKPFKRK